MTTQPEELLNRFHQNEGHWTTADGILAAAELRRLYALNQELLEALKELLQDTQHADHECGDSKWCPVAKARAAIRARGTDA